MTEDDVKKKNNKIENTSKIYSVTKNKNLMV